MPDTPSPKVKPSSGTPARSSKGKSPEAQTDPMHSSPALTTLRPGPYTRAEQGIKHNMTGFYKFLESREKKYGRGLWNMAMIDEVYQLSKALEKKGNPGLQTYSVTGFDGKKYKFNLPKFDPMTHELHIRLIGPLDLCQNIDDKGGFISRDPYHVVPYYVDTGTIVHKKKDIRTSKKNDDPKNPNEFEHVVTAETKAECDLEGRPEPWKDWIDKWNDSDTHKDMLDRLFKEHGQKLAGVDNIICFALGSLQTNVLAAPHRYFRTSPRIFMQHLLAEKIRDRIQNLPRGSKAKGKEITIIAQDPSYDDGCKDILRRVLNIHAVSDFTGFKSLTKNSLVISIAPSVDIVSIVCDILEPEGPLAMICNEIDLGNKDWRRRDDGTARIDLPTNLMAEYAAKCTSAYFGDLKPSVAMDEADLALQCAGFTLIAQLKRDHLECEAEDEKTAKRAKITFKQKFGKDYDEVKRILKDDTQRRTAVWLDDLAVYVRKR